MITIILAVAWETGSLEDPSTSAMFLNILTGGASWETVEGSTFS
jgi:hypothetical protein